MEGFCPHCHEKYEFAESQKGSLTECPSCRNLFHIPENDEDLARRYCPACGYLISADSVICINCGHNFKTGTPVVDPETNIYEENTPIWLKMLQLVAEYFPGLFRPVTLIMFILCVCASIFLVFLMLFVLAMGAFLGGIGIGVAAFTIYAQGVSFLMSGSLESLKSSMIDFSGGRMELFLLISFAPVIIIFLAMFTIAKFC